MRIYISNFNGVLDDLVSEVGKRGDLVTDWQDADVVVLWQDVIGESENVARLAKLGEKKVLVAEHGLLSINDYIPPLSRPLIADKFMAWGEETKRWLVNKAGINPDRVVVTGSLLPRRMIPRRKHDDKRILFAPRHWDKELQENLDVAAKLKECKYPVFSKLLAGENFPENYPHPMSTDRQGLNHIETCFEVLSWADVVIGLGEGTFGALAHLMDIPYISVDHWEDKMLLGKLYTRDEFKSQISKAAIQVPIESLLEQIDLCIKDPDINKKERKWFRKECLGYPGDSLKKTLDAIYG